MPWHGCLFEGMFDRTDSLSGWVVCFYLYLLVFILYQVVCVFILQRLIWYLVCWAF